MPENLDELLADFAPTYSASSTYAVGDYVIREGQLYRCTTAVTTAADWATNSSKFTAVTVGGELSELSGEIDNCTSILNIDASSPNLFDDSTYVGGYAISEEDDVVEERNWGYITANVSQGTYYLLGVLTGETTYSIITDLNIGYYDENGDRVGFERKNSASNGIINVPEGTVTAKISAHNYALGHSTGSLTMTLLMLTTTDYYTQNVTSASDYVAYYQGTGAITVKQACLPDTVVLKTDYELVPAIESYFETEATQTVNSILAKCDSPCTVLQVVTDSHVNFTNATGLKRAEDTFNNLRHVDKRVWVDGLVHAGDLLKADDSAITQTLCDQYLNYIRARLSDAKDTLYIIQGNHDGLNGSVPQTQNYNSLSKFNSAYVVRDGDSPYFYVDFENPKVRAIFLAFPQHVTIGETEYNYWGLYTPQLRWLGQTALNVDDGRNVIIFSHIGTQSSDFRKNRDQAVGICNAFNAHSTFAVYYENTQNLLYTADFTALQNSKIVLWVCGHQHYDWVVPEANSGLTFPLVTLTCSLCANQTVPEEDASAGAVAPSRTESTVTQDAWTTIIYRPDENKIYFIRFGAGDDFTVDLTDYASFA